jgi:hypothetical protein
VQETLLAAHPEAPLRVYAVWVDRRAGDSRGAWDGGGLIDPRVRHFWDGDDVTGRWFVDHVPGYRGSDWDAYLLFGPDAVWRAFPAPLLSSGSTVIRMKDDLAREIGPWLVDRRPAMDLVRCAPVPSAPERRASRPTP